MEKIARSKVESSKINILEIIISGHELYLYYNTKHLFICRLYATKQQNSKILSHYFVLLSRVTIFALAF